MTKRAGPRYAILPADAVTDERLVGADLKVLALLGRHIDKTGWCVRTQGRMAEDLRIARGTIQRALNRLVDVGYVEISASKRRDGGQGANRYRVILDEDARADQLDLFSSSADAVRPARSAERREVNLGEAPPCLTREAPPPHLGEAPPASPGRGTHKNDPFKNDPLRTSPPDAGAGPREGERGRIAANDPAPTDLRALGERLRRAAGDGINTAHPAFVVLTDPIGWLAAGCDLEADILPTIAGLSARHGGSPIRSWRYFASAVTEARDRRLTAVRRWPADDGDIVSTETTIVPFDPRGARHDEDHSRSAPSSADRLRAAFARRRSGTDGANAGGQDGAA